MAKIHQMAVKVLDDCEWLQTHEDFYTLLLRRSAIDERKRAHRFIHKIDSWRLLLGRNLTRYCISKAAKMLETSTELTFDEGEHGKPYLLHPRDGDIEFNISHAGDWVVTGVVASKAELGIDVAKVELREDEDLEEFFSQFGDYFSKYEWNQIVSGSSPEARLHSFYQFWVLKESYLKATGEGIAETDLASIEFTVFDTVTEPQVGSRYIEEVKTNIQVAVNSEYRLEYKFWLYYIDNNHVTALCCRPEHEFTEPRVISVPQILGLD